VKLNLKLLGNDLGEIDTSPVEEYLRSLPQLIRAFSIALFHPRVSGWMKLYAISGLHHRRRVPGRCHLYAVDNAGISAAD
jgi:hypothetical protein